MHRVPHRMFTTKIRHGPIVFRTGATVDLHHRCKSVVTILRDFRATGPIVFQEEPQHICMLDINQQ